MTDSEFDNLWTCLVLKKHGRLAGELTKQERLFYATNRLRGSVPRSGFIGYYDNSTGDDIRDAHEALAIMGLDKCLDLLKKAQAVILGNSQLPTGNQPVQPVSKELSEEEYIRVSDKLDRALKPIEELFYECDDGMFDALCAFAEEHNLINNDAPKSAPHHGHSPE